jgi:hypothetical protein
VVTLAFIQFGLNSHLEKIPVNGQSGKSYPGYSIPANNVLHTRGGGMNPCHHPNFPTLNHLLRCPFRPPFLASAKRFPLTPPPGSPQCGRSITQDQLGGSSTSPIGHRPLSIVEFHERKEHLRACQRTHKLS